MKKNYIRKIIKALDSNNIEHDKFAIKAKDNSFEIFTAGGYWHCFIFYEGVKMELGVIEGFLLWFCHIRTCLQNKKFNEKREGILKSKGKK